MPLGYTTRIEIVKPGRKTDPYNPGGAVLDWSPEAVTVVPVERLVSVQPNAQTETADHRVLLTSGWLLVTPPGMDLPLSAIDRVRFAGREVQVDGDVARWPHPTKPGGVHHVEAQLTAVSG
ncbi:hypothetical protein SEA_SCHMIDT_11 [Gordonia phage Schmidt]|uniref:Head-to-tail stopper n=1 Tax=Gordonia phage Schmidt TaxID=2301697 RepID=A0A385E041_9CAUD|nr:head closure Hc1 [Gordonia phage Schmidt]AXQ65133.1 hypothetical protein SEA_SCHMIDT_11 [Gordonia phage Schmidt]